jgi:GNAT superfamily N-acetyltransferase
MLAVREGYRNRGLGAQLKLEQRREALKRGIRHMEWTFDPLEIKNAFSISTSWERRSHAGTRRISMVYPHLDCKVGSRRTAWWPSGSLIRTG